MRGCVSGLQIVVASSSRREKNTGVDFLGKLKPKHRAREGRCLDSHLCQGSRCSFSSIDQKRRGIMKSGVYVVVAVSFALFWWPDFGSAEDLPASERPSPMTGRSRSCDILFAVDEPLWDLRDHNMTYMVEMANHMVDSLNEIFTEQVFTGAFDDLYFRLARVQVSYWKPCRCLFYTQTLKILSKNSRTNLTRQNVELFRSYLDHAMDLVPKTAPNNERNS